MKRFIVAKELPEVGFALAALEAYLQLNSMISPGSMANSDFHVIAMCQYLPISATLRAVQDLMIKVGVLFQRSDLTPTTCFDVFSTTIPQNIV